MRATIGVPSIGSSSLFGPPMRVDRPAASNSAAIRGPGGTFARTFGAAGCGLASARGNGRDGISASRPPAPMRMISSRPTGTPAQRRSSTQSKPLTFGERAQPGRPSTGVSPSLPEQQHVAGIDRHAEMLDPAAGLLDRRRDHVAPIDDDRGAVHQHHLGAGIDGGGDEQAPARRPYARSAPRIASAEPSAASRVSVTARVLSRMLSFSPGSRVWISATRRGANAATRSSGSALGREGGGARHRCLRHRERDDLHRRHHLPRLDDREGRQGAERHGLVDEVEPVEPVAVEHQEAARLGDTDWRAR